MKEILRRTRRAAPLLLLLCAAPAAAQMAKLRFSDAIQSVKFGGDLRLRHDSEAKRGAGTNDRNRLRLRLRFGADIVLPDDFTVNLRLASGTGEQVSTNQSFGRLSSQKSLWIDTAYLRWTPTVSEDAGVTLTGGRSQNLLWRPYSADLIWDDDLNPEGLQENVEYLLPVLGGISVFANGLQMAINESASSGKNQWLFSQQAGFESHLPWESRLRLAAAYHKWSDPERMSMSAGAAQDGNRRAASGLLLNRYGVGEVSGQISSWVGKKPVSLQATLARNLSARGLAGAGVAGGPARDGYQFGLVLGSTKLKGEWEAAYFKKYAQTDVTVADAADSDFGDGGTNRRGHIAWVAYCPRDWMTLKAKGFVTETVDPQFNPGDKAVNRLQLDVSVKF